MRPNRQGTTEKTYIDSDEMDFSVTVLASFGGRHVDDLARAACSSCQRSSIPSRTDTYP